MYKDSLEWRLNWLRKMTIEVWRVKVSEGINYWFNPGRFGIREDLPADTQLAVKVFGGKVVKARLIIED